jgi:hypothetical protein
LSKPVSQRQPLRESGDKVGSGRRLNTVMTDKEHQFMILACETSDAQVSDPLFLGSVDPILAALKEKGITEKEVWECQLSLKRDGYIRLYANYNIEPVEPTWSRAAPEFKITPKGVEWWRMRQRGADYSKIGHDPA